MMSIKQTSVSIFILALAVVIFVNVIPAHAQLEEPELGKVEPPKTPFTENKLNSIGFDFFINNFGFGIGGTYARAIAPFTQLSFRTGITGIRNTSEQNFQSFFTGQQIIPNKYKRAFGFPFIFGVKQRLFPYHLDDSFRFFISGGVGPAMAFTYPYVRDSNGNGFRDFRLFLAGNNQTFLSPAERINDFFTGWKNGETHWGLSGEIKIGVDLGSSFGSQTTVEFGYFFYYFKQGLQIMEPYKPFGYTTPTQSAPGFPVAVDEDGERNRFHHPQKYFGTPQIKFTFGGMW